MIIDTKGKIVIQNFELVITPEFTLDELKSNPHFADFEYWGSNDNYVRYLMRNVLIDNLPFSAYLIFYENKISRINIHYTELTAKSDYNDVEKTKAQINLTKEKHDEWIFKQHGTLSPQYSWGSIGSYLDDKSYMATIAIIYTHPKMNILKRILNK